MNDWRSGFLETNGIKLHYTRTGGDKPPLVLAHGVTDDGHCWTPVAKHLQADYDIIMLDARGHGRSEAPESGYNPVTMAADLAGAIRKLGLRRPAILGHSMGAITTLVLAGIDPDLPGAILLEDPPAWWAAPPLSAAAAAERRETRRAGLEDLKRKTRAELIAHQRREQPGWSDAELEPWADAKVRVSRNVLGLFNFDPATVDWPTILRRVTCPALLIAADPARGAIVDEPAAAALHALVPQLRTVRIPDAGHSIHRDRFAPSMTEIAAFLADTTS